MVMKHLKKYVIIDCLFTINFVHSPINNISDLVILFLEIYRKRIVQHSALSCFLHCSTALV